MSRPKPTMTSSSASRTLKMLEQKQCASCQTCTNRETSPSSLSRSLCSIQDLEKEREDIMNLFETQINSALSKGFPEDLSRASTPLGSVASSPKPRQGRPSTRDSAQTGLSRFTVESRPISVLGAARARPEGLSRGETEEERMIWERTDGIAARMASIQQKVRAMTRAALIIARNGAL